MASPLLILSGATVAAAGITALVWRNRVLARELRSTREMLAVGPTATQTFATSVASSVPSSVATAAAAVDTSTATTPSDDWLALPARSALDALWDWDVIGDRIRFSSRWRELLGHPAEEVHRASAEWWNRVHPSDRTQLEVDVLAQLSGGDARFAAEHRVRHEDGRWLTLQWAGTIRRDANGRAVRVTGSVRDITLQRSSEERQRRESLYDALTGLPNRALAIDLIRRAVARTRRQPERRFAALYVDLDRFNILNDSLGHAAGDALLRGVAQRLATAIRPGDAAARLGGDEFLLLLDEITDIADAEGVADRVKLVLTEPIRVFTHEVVVTSSIGIVMHDPQRTEPTDYLRDAELAMHGAKRGGRARHECFQPEMRDGVRRRMSLEQDLRGALDRGEFSLLYQPVWETREGVERLSGFEALLRWNHPQRGTLAPGDFVPVAEESAMIVGLGAWALTKACVDLAELAPNGDDAPWVSVNVAARQLADRGLIATVDTALRESGLVATRLKLEVTENVILHDEQAARVVLETLRDRGIRSLMDDFGTGHASLSYLHRLPIGAIKIDRYFVGRMDVSMECREIVRSIIALGRSLGMDVVAEGVEHEAQLALLREMECHATQGFLLARPLMLEEAQALVAALGPLGAACPRGVLRELGLAGGHRPTPVRIDVV